MKRNLLSLAVAMVAIACASAQTAPAGVQAVDLDLPSGLKWATMNVGATAPEAYGDYFAWGETETKTNYTWNNYKFTTDGGTTFTKYTETDGKLKLDPEDDAAAVNWGGKWRMPTQVNWTELRENCTWTWTSRNGVNGYEVKGKNGNSIFLPAAGYRDGNKLSYDNSYGNYWSGSLSTDNPDNAWLVYLGSYTVDRVFGYRCRGLSVRPVQEGSTSTALQPAESVAIHAENGRVVCEEDFRIYDLLGRDVTKMNGSLNGVYVVKTADAAQKVVVK